LGKEDVISRNEGQFRPLAKSGGSSIHVTTEQQLITRDTCFCFQIKFPDYSNHQPDQADATLPVMAMPSELIQSISDSLLSSSSFYPPKSHN
jgi:hypothetical protein